MRNQLSDRDLIARARHTHAHITRVGNTIWACQIKKLVKALADRVESLTSEPECSEEVRIETEQPWLFGQEVA